MPIKLTAPDFEDFLIASPTGTWVPSSRWEATDHENFLALRKDSTSSLDKAPKILHQKKRPEPFLGAQWVFKDEGDKVTGWAELQAFPRKHFTFAILLTGITTEDPEKARVECAFLLSYAFLVGRFDSVRLIPSASSLGVYESIREWAGEEKTVVSLAARPSLQTTWTSTPVLDVNRQAWIECTDTQHSLRSLSHVKARVERYDHVGGRKKQKKRSLLARLFRPRIEDSLF